jgi:hypothetical protein
MSATHGWSMIATGTALMLLGLAMTWASFARSGRRRARAHRPAAGLSVALTCTSLGGGVIAAAEWLILSRTGPGAVWVAVLAVPAFLAAATVMRLLGVARTIHVRRQVRAVRRGRRCHR